MSVDARRILAAALALMTAGPAIAATQEPAGAVAGQPGRLSAAIQDGFESETPVWREEETDATFVLRAHEIVTGPAREGERAERFVFEAGPGSVLYYSYPLPRIPITADLRIQLFARASRPGVRLYARVVLPADRDPETGRPSFLVIPGTAVDEPERWQRLELSGLPLAVERQARVLRVSSDRPVRLDGAYLDRLLINLYGGPGESEVLLDDLRIEPVPADLLTQAADDEAGVVRGSEERSPAPGDRFRMVGNFLTKDGVPWVPRAVSATGLDIQALRRAGFDVLEVSSQADGEYLRRATQLGYWLMPVLANHPDAPVDDVMAEVAGFPQPDAVAFWNLGTQLGAIADPARRRRELEHTRDLIARMRRDRSRPGQSRLTFGTVSDLYPQYALFGRHLDIVAVEPPGIGAQYQPLEIYRLLIYKRQLAATKNPNALFWAWVPTSAPTSLRRAVWGDDPPPAWGWPSAQPEQIRMLVYAALSAGYRGLGFRSDAELDRPGGLDRLLELTLLIAEVELVESILGRATDPIPQWPAFPADPKRQLVYTPNGGAGGMGSGLRPSARGQTAPLPEVKAYPTLRVSSIDVEDNRTRLLIVNDYAAGGLWQPGQMGYRDVNLIVPAPESAQAYEISFGDVQALESRRDAGGRRLTIPIVNGTALILLTSDMALVDRIRQQVWALRPRAIDLAIKQAELRIQEAIQLNGLLEQRGFRVRDAADLLEEGRKMVASARDAYERQDYPTAWSEARSVGQPVRMVLRAHFERLAADFAQVATASLAGDRSAAGGPVEVTAPPVGCPPLLTCQTLPQYAYWRSFVGEEAGRFVASPIASGDFEATPERLRQQGWTDAAHPVDGLQGTIRIAGGAGFAGSSGLRLVVEPEQRPKPEDFRKPDGSPDRQAYAAARKAVVDALPALVDWPVAAVQSPEVAVRAGELIRIRVKYRLLRSIGSAGGGLIVRESIGGTPLQFRTTEPNAAWRELVLYRRVPEDGGVSITLGLAGPGEALFDDLRIESLRHADSTPEHDPGPDSSRREPIAALDSQPSRSTTTPRPAVPSASLPVGAGRR
ncbi:MAG: hypothetical protein KatS3mg108_1697 [Isosphaeraceae bacterium]|jgi:hypothetical protein|nr:MAG: hypothetical protein KatS3mg108_1697 [Isosphaeraceae bacterium]